MAARKKATRKGGLMNRNQAKQLEKIEAEGRPRKKAAAKKSRVFTGWPR